ncbi:hypothetical protein CDEST_05720 [Colletotrichum destructivum]|uniref:Zonadhesin n=1 Tax=Colletotrichum destructivum TaxID=34406 RepID=A0AAX4IBH2_9PEZI|nr:hypothetical protein CDEST_05720 [Colletotrichum destructivum]
MHQPPPADQSTFESRAKYNLQATEDAEEEEEERRQQQQQQQHQQNEWEDDEADEPKKNAPPPIPRRPNYRPKPLRWPFIVCMVVLLSVLMGLVVYARETMPNSDSTATIEPRRVLQARQEATSTEQQQQGSTVPTAAPSSVVVIPATSEEKQPSTPASAAVPSPPSVSSPNTPTAASVPAESGGAPTTNPVIATQVEDTSAKGTSNAVSDVRSSQATSQGQEVLSPFSGPTASASKTQSNSAATRSDTSGSASIDAASSRTQETTGKTSPTDITSSSQSSVQGLTTPNSVTVASKETGTSKDVSNTRVSSLQASITSKPDGGTSQTKDISVSGPLTTGGSSGSASSSDLAGQRKAPGISSSTASVSITSLFSSSPSVNTILKPTGSNEVISIATSLFTTTLTRSASTFTYTTGYTSYVSSSFTTVIPTTFPGSTATSTFTTVITTAVTKTTTRMQPGGSIMTTLTMPVTSTRTVVTSDGSSTYSLTTVETGTRVETSAVAVSPRPTVDVTTEVVEVTRTDTTRVSFAPATGFITSTGVAVVPTTVASVVTSTGAAVVYVSVGTTEITRIITIPGGSRGQQHNDPTPVTQVFTSVIDQKVVTVVETGAPQRVVVTDGGVITAVFTPPPETIVTRNGGQQTEMVIMVTPSPNAAFVAVPTVISGKSTVVMVESTFGAGGVFKEVATTIGGKATVVNVPVNTPEPVLVAVQTTIDGKPTVLLVASTPSAGFKPVSLTVVSQVGGSTGVFTTTDPPETIRTVIDGKETTIVRTPAPREFTSVVGGTPTTFEIVTTPTGTMPLSFTVITTVGGSVSTIVSTPRPTTLVTSISGKLSTITSTPTPTTRLSTMKASTVTLTSVSRPTSTEPADNVITEIETFSFTNGDYFVGKFLPVILAVTITIPLRIIDLNAKLYQPFFAMAQEGGALGKNSVTLKFDGWKGLLAPFQVLLQGHPVPFITTLMLWSSALLVPLATEAIGMKLHGRCKVTAIDGCAIELGVSTVSAHALVALLAFIIVLLLVLLYFLRNWETGLHANPWSIAGMSSLARNPDVRPLQIDFKASEKAMAEKSYMLGFFENSHGRDEYGIIYSDDSSQDLQAAASGALPAVDDDDEVADRAHQLHTSKKPRKTAPFIALTYWWRLGFIFFLTSLFILVLYYHVTLRVRTSFKDVTDSQTWGVRFFLSALGVTTIFCWESIFVSVAIISPYYHMGRRSQQPESSILITRPTNSFYGLYAAIMEGNIVLLLAAFMAILAEFLPILLTNIPYNLTQTLVTHNICALTSVSILALMIAALVASLFVRWPEMPVDPRSIAGAMYYVNESRMLEDFEGFSKLDSKEREKRVRELGRRYFYGAITGKHGRRMGVESVESVEDTAYTGGHWFLPQVPTDHHDEEVSESEHGDNPDGDPEPERHEAGHQEMPRALKREVGLI